MTRRNRSGAPLQAGDQVRISADVAGPGDPGTLRGEVGEVVGANPHYRHKDTGKVMTAVRLPDGDVVTVPHQALKRE